MTEIKSVFEKIDFNYDFKEYSFHSGIQELDKFYYENSSELIRYGYSQIYILREFDKPNIIGYFSISSSTIQWEESLLIEKITRYVPGILLGMFAIDERFRRKKYGSDLIKKAINIALKISNEIGCRCVFVDSFINLDTLNFYLNMGFDFVDKPLGKKIIRKLSNNEKIDRNTIKMYFDLYKIKK